MFRPIRAFASLSGIALVIIGILLIVYGVIVVVGYFSTPKELRFTGFVLVDGILTVLLGILALIASASAAMLVIIPVALGIWMIAKGAAGIGAALTAKNAGAERWWTGLLFGIICIVAGILAFCFPGGADIVVMIIVGVHLISSGALAITEWNTARKLAE